MTSSHIHMFWSKKIVHNSECKQFIFIQENLSKIDVINSGSKTCGSLCDDVCVWFFFYLLFLPEFHCNARFFLLFCTKYKSIDRNYRNRSQCCFFHVLFCVTTAAVVASTFVVVVAILILDGLFEKLIFFTLFVFQWGSVPLKAKHHLSVCYGAWKRVN